MTAFFTFLTVWLLPYLAWVSIEDAFDLRLSLVVQCIISIMLSIFTSYLWKLWVKISK